MKTSIRKFDTSDVEKDGMDVAIDWISSGVKQISESKVISEVPILKTLAAGYSGYNKFLEYRLMRKFFEFLDQFRANNISEDEMAKFRIKFEDDPSYHAKVLEHLMVYINQFTEVEKSKIFANLLIGCFKGKYDWSTFENLSVCLEKMNLSTISFLEDLSNQEIPFYKVSSNLSFNVASLASAGLIQQLGTNIVVTDPGIQLYYYGVLADYDKEILNLDPYRSQNMYD